MRALAFLVGLVVGHLWGYTAGQREAIDADPDDTPSPHAPTMRPHVSVAPLWWGRTG